VVVINPVKFLDALTIFALIAALIVIVAYLGIYAGIAYALAAIKKLAAA